MSKHKVIEFTNKQKCKICIWEVCACSFIYKLLNCLCCCVCAFGQRNSRSRDSTCCFGRNEKLYDVYQRGVSKLNRELDILKLLKRVRQHHQSLKSSVLCNKERRTLLKHARKNLINFDTDSDPEISHHSDENNHEVLHGACRNNEDLITENIKHTIVQPLQTQKHCICQQVNDTADGHS